MTRLFYAKNGDWERTGRTPIAAPTEPGLPSPSSSLYGWQLTASNVGLVGVGIDRATLPVYTGPTTVPAGTTISNKKVTVPLDISAGNIIVEKCWIAPTSYGEPFSTFVHAESMLGDTVVRDCEIDGTQLPLTITLAQACGFVGLGLLQRNYIHGMGSGMLAGGPASSSGTFETNYITGLRAFGDPATTGSHNECATVREFPQNPGNTRTIRWKNNRLNCDTAGNDTGALFIQPLWNNISRIFVEGNLLEGGGFNLYIETNAFTYSSCYATNNRFRPTGYGASAVSNGPGWTTWSENYIWDPAAANGKGAHLATA